jgi:hypothetical protein
LDFIFPRLMAMGTIQVRRLLVGTLVEKIALIHNQLLAVSSWLLALGFRSRTFERTDASAKNLQF